MPKIHLIMPMAGAGSRFAKNGITLPKPMIEIQGKPFFYWGTMSVLPFVPVQDVTYVVLQEHVDQFHIDQVINTFFPRAKIVILPHILQGPVFTALAAVEKVYDALPLVINDCDHMFYCPEMYAALNGKVLTAAGGLLTFISQEPQFSYVKYDNQHRIAGTIEKQVVSDHAICGAYTFGNAQIFRQIASLYTQSCPYNECFMSGMYNVMQEKRMTITEFVLAYHVEFGTPAEYASAKKSPYFAKLVQEMQR